MISYFIYFKVSLYVNTYVMWTSMNYEHRQEAADCWSAAAAAVACPTSETMHNIRTII